ncbi:MAG: tRNA 2-selenouridine(34) synthase MnmH [Saprospiraceae bacterium]|nr:tRNA 2-selenouridine(34) synthase MnmH [Saprospiraceae bacterium]
MATIATGSLDEAVVIDVRTPAEFERGHIPGAVNLPLFSNAERAVVGTIYKKDGPEPALHKGLELVGPRMPELARQAGLLIGQKKALVHCWRGGKRSASMAWLLAFCGHQVAVLEGGYKAYRRWAQATFADDRWHFTVLGGRTGSGKTDILHRLSEMGEQVIDLESLACHKGSAFGWIGENPQPSAEQFQNLLYEALRRCDPDRRIWIENESKCIGRVYLPDQFWARMKQAPLIHIEVPDKNRIDRLVRLYAGRSDISQLSTAFERIGKRLGGQHLKAALEALEANDFHSAARIALTYYDKTYDFNLRNNPSPSIHIVALEHPPGTVASCHEIITFADSHIGVYHAASGI